MLRAHGWDEYVLMGYRYLACLWRSSYSRVILDYTPDYTGLCVWVIGRVAWLVVGHCRGDMVFVVYLVEGYLMVAVVPREACFGLTGPTPNPNPNRGRHALGSLGILCMPVLGSK